MKKMFARAFLGLISLAVCITGAQTGTSAAVAKDFGLQNYFEKNEVIEGDLEIVAECEETNGRTLYFINTASGRVELQFANSPDTHLRTGSHVRVEGTYINDSFVVTDEIKGADADQQDLTTTGEHKVLVILVNFQDKQTQPFTVEQVRDVAFTQTSNYFREASYGQTWLTGDVSGWFTIPVSSTICDKNAIATAAKQAAINAGVDLNIYQHLVYAFPENACTFPGSSTVGGIPYSQGWINGNFSVGNVGHELGHGFGLYHSHSLDCGAVVIGGTCTVNDYGNMFDIMGGGWPAHTNLFQKEMLGWTLPQTVTSSGTYQLDPFETVGGVKGLKILKSTDPVTGRRTWYYVEQRKAFGFDSYMAQPPYLGNTNVLDGVTVNIGTDIDGNSNYLLDMIPATNSWYDLALTTGRSFSDPTAGVTITTISAGAAGAQVNVVVPGQSCVRSNPTLTVSPAQSPGVPAGSTVSFNLTVTNNDTGGCGASTFNLQAPVPANWLSSYGSPTLLINPGSAATTTLQVTSPVGAANGLYSISLGVANSSSPLHSASTTITYTVAPPVCVRANPTLSVSPAQSPGLPSGSTVIFDLTVRNNDTGGCGPSTFNLQSPVWANWNAVFDSPTLLINQGSSVSTALRITSPVGAAVGFYNITLAAVNASSPANTASATVQIQIVPPPCVRSNPTLTALPAQGPEVPPGSTVSFNLTVTNNDTGGCAASELNLQAHVPGNWIAVFGSSTPLIGPGSSATTNLQITSSIGAPGGIYPINITAINVGAPTSASSMNVTYSIVSGVAVTAAATQTSYTRSQTATVNATVLAGGALVPGAVVVFTMTKANGTVLMSTRTTGSNGVATFSYVLSRKKDPVGTYQVRAQVNTNGTSGTGTTSFVVR